MKAIDPKKTPNLSRFKTLEGTCNTEWYGDVSYKIYPTGLVSYRTTTLNSVLLTNGQIDIYQGKFVLVLETSPEVRYQGSPASTRRKAVEKGLSEMLGMVL